MDKLSPKERFKIPRTHMPEQPAQERAHNFTEVNLGLQVLAAQHEAQRCLDCASPACTKGCPVGVKVAAFVDKVLAGEFAAAAGILRQDNVLPAITGRVCPQEEQCEGACLLAKRGNSLAIGHLERFVADWERQHGVQFPPKAPPTGKKVAIVGSGPAGLTCAGDLIQKGHQVTVFEALHEIGGVLVYGIPEFRLPKAIVRQEVDNLRQMGVDFQTNVVIGRTVTIDQLMNEEHYDAVFVATGAGLPQFMNIPGEHFNGVCSANEFLTRINLMKAYRDDYDQPVYDVKGQNVAVIGGGNVAMDAVRTALRLGAKNAWLIYRRTEAEMPARVEEVKHAKEEGVQFLLLQNPVEFLGDDKGWLRKVRVQKMQLGEPDKSGRPRPVPIPGSEYELEVGMAIVAIGTSANPLVQSTTPDMKTRKGGYIEADPATLRTSKKGVFAGGDIVSGAATVILAMGAGRTAAKAIDAYLQNGTW